MTQIIQKLFLIFVIVLSACGDQNTSGNDHVAGCRGDYDCASGRCASVGGGVWQCMNVPLVDMGTASGCKQSTDCKVGEICLLFSDGGHCVPTQMMPDMSVAPPDLSVPTDLTIVHDFAGMDLRGSCNDQVKNGDETDVDCGGSCPACAPGKVCTKAADCGMLQCLGGKCSVVCGVGLATCDYTTCVSLSTDVKNCGQCGVNCAQGQMCVAGVCSNGCNAPNTMCGNLCVDTKTNVSNCGGCGVGCPGIVGGTPTCTQGVCGGTCPQGKTLCGVVCVDTQTDTLNCGKCGASCALGTPCVSGVCGGNADLGNLPDLAMLPDLAPPPDLYTPGDMTLACANGLMVCGNVCANITSDNAHCGKCGNACPMGQVCSQSACVLGCGFGLTNCGVACANLQTDSANCGVCGHACNVGQSCVGGLCINGCAPPTTLCGNVCVNLMTDNANCGKCAAACPQGQTCVAGACAVPADMYVAPDMTPLPDLIGSDMVKLGAINDPCKTTAECGKGLYCNGLTCRSLVCVSKNMNPQTFDVWPVMGGSRGFPVLVSGITVVRNGVNVLEDWYCGVFDDIGSVTTLGVVPPMGCEGIGFAGSNVVQACRGFPNFGTSGASR